MSEQPGKAIGVLGRHGEQVVAQRVEPGDGFRLVSHNFCDPCTWWQGSDHEAAGACTNSGDNLTYTLDGMSSGWVIDARHHRFTYEGEITPSTVSPQGNTMTDLVPTVLLDGVELDQALEDATSGDDRYTIQYSSSDSNTPSVTFAVARAPAVVVTMRYRKANSSEYIWAPKSGKRMVFEDAEVDHTSDLDMNATLQTTIYGSHSALTGGAVVPLGSKSYNRVRDFHAAAKEFMGPIPSGLGGTGGVPVDLWTWKWGYSRADEFYDTANYLDQNGYPTEATWNRASAKLVGDQPYGGTYLTVTYYGQQANEGE